eukprot:GHVP01031368.1.p1 GENE.GHVP01031368.1~~GHVP01031368.1.p1  ORF type:complete len:553 (+),score=144.07 GHVP01031368.1:83-1741(+)
MLTGLKIRKKKVEGEISVQNEDGNDIDSLLSLFQKNEKLKTSPAEMPCDPPSPNPPKKKEKTGPEKGPTMPTDKEYAESHAMELPKELTVGDGGRTWRRRQESRLARAEKEPKETTKPFSNSVAYKKFEKSRKDYPVHEDDEDDLEKIDAKIEQRKIERELMEMKVLPGSRIRNPVDWNEVILGTLKDRDLESSSDEAPDPSEISRVEPQVSGNSISFNDEEDANVMAMRALKASWKGDVKQAEALKAKVSEKVKHLEAVENRKEYIPKDREEEYDYNKEFVRHLESNPGVYDDEDSQVAEKGGKYSKRKHSGQRGGRKFRSRRFPCSLCMENSSFRQEKEAYVIIKTENAYLLQQDPKKAICERHYLICSVAHVTSTLELDDNAYEEIRNLQKILVSILDQEDYAPVFMETVRDFPSTEGLLMGQGTHCCIEVVALLREDYEFAKGVYKKAMAECQSEWATHRKVISTSGRRGLHGFLPPKFPFFHVDFSLSGGYCISLDQPKEFSRDFGLSVACGILELSEYDRPFANSEIEYKKLFLTFKEKFKNLKLS